jgi:hypothetical protein
MFEPELIDSDCPKCSRRKVYFDREIGYYCMYCGHELTEDETIILTEQLAQTSRPKHTSPGKTKKQPPTQIQELPARKKKQPDHVRNNKTTN